VPHPPAFYSRRKGELTAHGPVSYLDNVALADRTLGDLRQAMERAGVWDRTALVVTADHGWRRGYWHNGGDWTAEDEALDRGDPLRVPFLVKMPGQTAGYAHDRDFQTVTTRAIVTGVLTGEIAGPAQLARTVAAP
jgi:arylsulfatase A-like enzyme